MASATAEEEVTPSPMAPEDEVPAAAVNGQTTSVQPPPAAALQAKQAQQRAKKGKIKAKSIFDGKL